MSPLARLLALAGALVLASSGCINRVEVLKQDPVRASKVKEIAILPFAGVDVKNYQVKSDGGEEAETWNKQAADQYGAFPKRFADRVIASTHGAAVTYAEKEPTSGYFLKGLFEKVKPGSSGLRIGGAFTPYAGAAMKDEGKIEVRFTCWLKEGGKNAEEPIATMSGVYEDDDSWSGGYEAMWDHAEVLADHLAARLKEVAPAIGGK